MGSGKLNIKKINANSMYKPKYMVILIKYKKLEIK